MLLVTLRRASNSKHAVAGGFGFNPHFILTLANEASLFCCRRRLKVALRFAFRVPPDCGRINSNQTGPVSCACAKAETCAKWFGSVVFFILLFSARVLEIRF